MIQDTTLRVDLGTAASRDPEAARFFAERQVSPGAIVMGLFDSSDDCIKLIDPQGRLQLMNCNGRAAMEIDDFCAVEGSQWQSLWPKEAQPLLDQALAAGLNGERARFEAFCPTAKGSPRWWDVIVNPVIGDNGQVEWLLASSRDITERMARGEQLEVMAAEMRHRLRNAFTVSSGIVSAMARAKPGNAEFASDVVMRLSQLSTVHAALLDHAGKIALRELLEKVLLVDSRNSLIAIVDVPAIELSETIAKAIALVVGELGTNSMKYGALGNGGRIVLSASLAAEKLTLLWDESDGAGQAGPQGVSSGQGSKLSQRMLNAIGGTLKSEELPDGFKARISIPV